MRLILALLWFTATILWLPWFAVLLRFFADLALGVPPGGSDWLKPALIGPWPLYGWRHWAIVSWYPLFGAAGMALSALAWRLHWVENGWRLNRPIWQVVLSIIIPPVAPLLLWRQTRRELAALDTALSAEAAQQRDELIQRGEVRPEQIEQAALAEPLPLSYRSFVRITAWNFALWTLLAVVLLPWWVGLLGFLSIEFVLFILPALRQRDLPEL